MKLSGLTDDADNVYEGFKLSLAELYCIRLSA